MTTCTTCNSPMTGIAHWTCCSNNKCPTNRLATYGKERVCNNFEIQRQNAPALPDETLIDLTSEEPENQIRPGCLYRDTDGDLCILVADGILCQTNCWNFYEYITPSEYRPWTFLSETVPESVRPMAENLGLELKYDESHRLKQLVNTHLACMEEEPQPVQEDACVNCGNKLSDIGFCNECEQEEPSEEDDSPVALRLSGNTCYLKKASSPAFCSPRRTKKQENLSDKIQNCIGLLDGLTREDYPNSAIDSLLDAAGVLLSRARKLQEKEESKNGGDDD